MDETTMTSPVTPPAKSATSSETPAVNVRIYNTLTRKKEPLRTVRPGHVGIYLCGPTVYREAHIGHMVGPVIFDTIKRYLTYCGYDVTWVVNITDVDDKLIVESNRRQVPMAQVAEEMTADYLANLQALGVDQIDHLPRATEYMDEIIGFIEQLIERGYAYESEGDVYFEVARDASYGKLSNRTSESLQGEGGGTASRKRALGDFALWKRTKADEPSWDSPWGAGRPGWHIECSAMSRKLLGETFDIHGGGLDLMFPHHENEIAQSECCHNKPMVNFWVHNGLMKADASAGKVGGRGEREKVAQAEADVSAKISRSQGAGGLAALIQQQGGERLRFFLLRTHYRSTIVFGDGPLQEAGAALEAFYRLFQRFERLTGTSFYHLSAPSRRSDVNVNESTDPWQREIVTRRAAFLDKMDDDFNTGAAVSELFEFVRLLNRMIDQQQLEDSATRDPRALATFTRGTTTLKELANLLGLFRQPLSSSSGRREQSRVDDLMQLLIELRAEARQRKDFSTADRIRDGLAALGITLEDRKDGTGWKAD
jgi:cysteinyl-tRNA synthetase